MSFEVKDLGWKKLKKELTKLGTKAVKVGTFDPKLALIWFWNEKGTVRIPPRPAMQYSLIGFRYVMTTRVIQSAYSEFLKAPSAMKFLKSVGKAHKEILKETVIKWSEPSNAPSTIKRKGFNDPLIHTKKLLKSIDYKVTNNSND
jgi:hypothetical protein